MICLSQNASFMYVIMQLDMQLLQTISNQFHHKLGFHKSSQKFHLQMNNIVCEQE